MQYIDNRPQIGGGFARGLNHQIVGDHGVTIIATQLHEGGIF
ncbi:hypothetical protein JCM19233_3082 [Vibrio astriarenae]|nr:hypothetical protein JCM19233_3082 [Vibrio sp. C7]